MPNYEFELRALRNTSGPVVGIDEVGRGPLAGPVVAAAVILDPKRIPDGLDDSKKLTERRREQLFEAISENAIVGIGESSVAEIDQLNIRKATHLAMLRATEALKIVPAFALVDGNDTPSLPCPSETIIRGDSKSVSVAAASIVAKVFRDRLMMALHQIHPAYGWLRNKGYGTAQHLTALAEYGVTAHHRKSFSPIHNILYGDGIVDSNHKTLIQQDS